MNDCESEIKSGDPSGLRGLDNCMRGSVRRLCGTLLAVGLMAGAFSGGVYAQDTEAKPIVGSPNAKSTIAPIAAATLESEDPDESAEPAALVTGTGMLPASITAGAIDPASKVPVLDGIAGSEVTNSAVSIPLTVLTHGTSYCYTISLEDNNVTGDYELDYYIKQVVGGVTKTIDAQKIVTGKTTAPGDVWVWSIYGKALPDSPGIATLYGRVRWGTGYTTQAIVSSKILIQ
jgi:hypothetical protein